jgi:hypothetical protein
MIEGGSYPLRDGGALTPALRARAIKRYAVNGVGLSFDEDSGALPAFAGTGLFDGATGLNN